MVVLAAVACSRTVIDLPKARVWMRELLDGEHIMAMTLEIYQFRGLQAILLAWQGYGFSMS
jgi:hypothetical protein